MDRGDKINELFSRNSAGVSEICPEGWELYELYELYSRSSAGVPEICPIDGELKYVYLILL